MARFVLVHGAFRGGWAWDRVRPALVVAGHEVLAPTLAAEGSITLGLWADQVVDVLSASTNGPSLLVGHSQGGVVALAAAARRPDSVDHLILLDSPVPKPGQSAADVVPSDVRRAYGDPPLDAWVPPTPTGDPWVDERLVSAPVAPAYDPVDPHGNATDVPTTYVFCARTGEGVPALYSRQRFDAEERAYRLLDAEHDAPLRQPDLVSGLLLELVLTTA